MSNQTMRIEVSPIYGWGWRQGNESLPVPDKFVVESSKFDLQNGVLAHAAGRIDSASHPLNGAWVVLKQRSVIDGNVHCNVLIRSEPPSDDDQLTVDSKTLTGFAIVAG